MKKKLLIPALVVTALVLGLGLALWPRQPAPAAPSPAAAEAPALWPLQLRVAPGAVERYAFGYTQQVTADAIPTPQGPGVQQNASAALGGSVDLAGRLQLEGLAPAAAADASEVLLRFEAFDRHRFAIQGQDLLPDAATVQAQLLGQAARVTLSERGEVRGVAFAEGAHPMFERLVQLVLSESQLFLEPGVSTWSHDERSLHGEAATHYRLLAQDAERARVQKVRDGYATLQALTLHQGPRAQQHRYEMLAELSRPGTLLSLRGSEQLTVTAGGRRALALQSQLALEYLGRAQAAPAVASRFGEPQALGEVAPSAEAERQALVMRVDGLTRAQVLADLERFGFGAQMPDHNRWLWRTAGLIRLEPALVDDLVARFPSPKLRHEGRALLLDLLVGAQTYRAQEGILAALATDAARSDERYHLLFQRLNLLTHPSPETIAFLERTQAEGQGMQQALATNALGSAAGHLWKAGEIERSQALGDRLLAGLRAQADADGQVLYLTALGNAGLPSHVDALRGYAASPSSLVRWQTATSLRGYDDAASRGTLLELAADTVPRVQLRALISLNARKDLDAADVQRLGQLVAQRRIAETAYHEVITLLAPRLSRDPAVRQIFDLILTQDVKDRDILARIRTLLGG